MNKQQEKKIIGLVESAMLKSKEFTDSLCKDSNPQVKEMLVRHYERQDSMLAIIRAFKGDFVDLNIMAVNIMAE